MIMMVVMIYEKMRIGDCMASSVFGLTSLTFKMTTSASWFSELFIFCASKKFVVIVGFGAFCRYKWLNFLEYRIAAHL